MDWRVIGAQRTMVAVTLRAAAMRIHDDGWYQGRFRDPDSEATDATQAIAAVLGIDLLESSRHETRMPSGATALLGFTLDTVALETGDVLARWNDTVAAAAEDVVTLFERVADRCDDAESDS